MMTLQITPEQSAVLGRGEPAIAIDPATQERFAVLRAAEFQRILEDAEQERLQTGWRKLALRGVARALEEE